MPCPTCDHTMQKVADNVFWCERCGSILMANPNYLGAHTIPMLVGRIQRLLFEKREVGLFSEHERRLWHTLGIFEAIATPVEREVWP